MIRKHILVALVQNRPGVLNRIASTLRRRNFNIESIAVGHIEVSNLSRMTIVVEADDAKIEQVRKQLDRVVEVIRISDITNDNPVAREMAMIKVKATPSTRSEIIQVVDIFRANIVDVSTDSLIIVATGDMEKIETLIDLLRGFGIRELSRTGTIALPRGGAGPLTIEDNKPLRHVVDHASAEEENLPNW
ncbi:MAG: acetolactate synthase small subunit [Dehalococcoidia bacterium]|nr:acetolactate synthase small subunit [Dehalococcoidia bacterium]